MKKLIEELNNNKVMSVHFNPNEMIYIIIVKDEEDKETIYHFNEDGTKVKR